MTDDLKLVERLRLYRPTNEWGDPCHHVICDDAASTIVRLVCERDEARNTGHIHPDTGLIMSWRDLAEQRQKQLVEMKNLRFAVQADRDRLAKLVAEMAAWIRPLASAAAGLGDDGPDDRPVPIGRLSGGPMRFRADIVLTLGDLRRARALLQRTQEQVG